MFVTTEIWKMLKGEDTRFGFAPHEANLIADRYLAGFAMRIGRGLPPPKIKKRDQPNWEQLANLHEVWAMCIRKPTNGHRIFGRFMAKDLLVLSLPVDRNELGKQPQYEAKAATTIPIWEAAFPDTAPHTGADLSDYVTGVTSDAY